MSKHINCPTCNKKSTLCPSNPYRPFCSERCKLIDLGSWGSEHYKIPSAPTDEPAWEENNPDMEDND